MSSAQLNIAMVLKADVASAKAGLADVSTGLKAVSAEAGKTSSATAREAAELERMAQAAAKAARSQADLVAAERSTQATRSQQLIAPLANPQQSAAPVVAFWRASETAASSLRDTVAGLNVTVGQQTHEFMETAQAAAQWRAAMDDIRASFNPLYAASRQYEQQLERIAEAERLGAISAREAAAARERAAAVIAPTNGSISGSGGASGMHTANVAAQGFDIGVTAAMGMNPAMIGLQQGSQLVQVMQQMGGGKQALHGIASGFLSILNPMSLATMGFVAFGALGIQALMKLLPETKTTSEVLGDLADSVGRIKETSAQARRSMVDLGKEFGSTAGDAKKLLDLMTEIELRAATRKADDAVGNIYSELGGAWNYSGGRRDYLQRMLGERSLTGRVMATPGNSPQTFKVDAALEELDKARETDDLDKQIAAATQLVEVFDAAAKASGKITEEENTWLQQLGELVTELQRIKALKENAAGKAEAEAITTDLSQQIELERARLKFGQDSAQVRALENRYEREALALKLEGLGLNRQQEEWTRTMGALSDLQHQRELAALETRADWFRDQDDRIAAIRRETSLIGASASEQARVNALAEAEVDIRKRKLGVIEAVLVRMRAIATAQAEIDQARARAARELETGRIMDQYDLRKGLARDPRIRADIEAEQELVRQLRDGADPAHARAEADRVRSRALGELTLAQDRYLKSQDEAFRRQQLELALMGQSAAVRARVLALMEAEQQILETGATGDIADTMRRNAIAQAELAQVIEAQADAWKRVQSAGESAIDGVLDKLRGGDVKGAMAELLGEIEKGFFDLAVRNPLKNMLLGTNLGTWEDIGGWGGIMGRFTGAAPVDEARLARDAVMPLQTMTVTAANVILQGNLSGIPVPGAANANAAPMSFAAGLPGPGDVQAQIWSFFAARGLQPHQIAGIMGNASAESSFDPRAVGDAGQAFGLFQWNNRKGNLFDFIGGQQNLGDVQKQLEFAWHELMTSEMSAYRQLMASTDVRGATEAWAGFERPSGYSAANPAGSMHFDRRLAAAEQALSQFGNSVAATGTRIDAGGAQAAAGLAQAGQGAVAASQGMGVFGQLLSGIGGIVGGKTGSILNTVVGIGSALMGGARLFRTGGFTGGSDPDRAAGIVHEGEFVFDAVATRRIGIDNLEGIRKGGMRGFRAGGHVGPGPAAQAANMAAAPASAPAVPLHVSVDVSGAKGDKEIEAMVQQAVAAGIGQGFDTYDREVLPSRVREISNDRWGS